MDQRMQDMRIERTRHEATGAKSNRCFFEPGYGDHRGEMKRRHLYAWKHVPSKAPWEVEA